MVTRPFRFLLLLDLLVAGSYGLLFPIFPVFLVERLPDLTITRVALAYSLFLFTYSLFRWIYSAYLYHDRSLLRAKYGVVLGSLLLAFLPCAYILVGKFYCIMMIQVILGLGFGLFKPSWIYLAERSTDKAHHSSLTKIHTSLMTFIMASVAALGGTAAYLYGYDTLLLGMLIVGMSAAFLSIFAVRTVK